MTDFTRRTLVGTGAAAGLLAASPALAQAAAPVRVRRNIATMAADDPDLAAYVRGMRAMRKRADLVSWGQQVFLHSGDWGQHGGWRFLPWHRAQLYWFEKLIAKFSDKPDFAMPYWDWQTTPVLPAVIADPKGPLWHRSRRRDLASVDFVKERSNSDFIDWARVFQDSFTTFVGRPDSAGSVETSGHGFVHVTVRGDMGDTSTAPRDPLFWLHHCNVDRVWATWQPAADRRGVRPDPAWLAERFDMFVDTNGDKAKPLTTADVLDSRALGYRYDADYPLAWFDEQPTKPPAGKTKREVASTHSFKVALADQPGARECLRIPLPPDITALLGSDKTGQTFQLTGSGEVRLKGEKHIGTAVKIAVRRLGGAEPAVVNMATIVPFVGGHHPPHAAMPGMAAEEPHEHGFGFAVGPQLFDATGFDGVQEVEVQAVVRWLPVPPPPPAADGSYDPSVPVEVPVLPDAPLITSLSLDLTLTEFRWV